MRNSIFLILLLVLVSGCTSDTTIDNFTNVTIEKEGIYVLNNDLRLEISVNNGLVNYYLKNGIDNVLAEPEFNISTYQKWMAIWDGERLWFDSSDIGGVVWIKLNSIKYKNISFTDLGELSTKIPEPMYQNIIKAAKANPNLFNWKPKNSRGQ